MNKVRFLGYVFIILLLIAAYHDLNDHPKNSNQSDQLPSYSNYERKSITFQVVSYQINDGENFMSIIEKLNPQSTINIESYISDFQALNPKADIYQLEVSRIYLFPIYD